MKELLAEWVLLFIMGAVIGWVYEMGFYRIDRGKFIKRGHGIGPWLPIYGIGSLFILFCTYRFRAYPLLVFLISALVCGGLEFAAGWFFYHFFNGLRLWDYNSEIWNWGNIGGYVCLRSVLVFALAGLALVYFLFPNLCLLVSSLPGTLLYVVAIILAGLFLLDLLIGYFFKPLKSRKVCDEF